MSFTLINGWTRIINLLEYIINVTFYSTFKTYNASSGPFSLDYNTAAIDKAIIDGKNALKDKAKWLQVIQQVVSRMPIATNSRWNAVFTAKIATPVDFADNEKARFALGNDLAFITINSGNANVSDQGTGVLTAIQGSQVVY